MKRTLGRRLLAWMPFGENDRKRWGTKLGQISYAAKKEADRLEEERKENE